MKLSEAAKELELYATNVKAFIHPVIQTLSRHHRSGDFHYDRAIACIERYCLVPAAKQYKMEHGSMTETWHSMFPKPVRMEAAESICDHWIAEFRLGNYWD